MPRQSTMKTVTIPVVLVVAADAALIEQCRQAAKVAAAVVQDCDAGAAATQAARWRPFALVLPDPVYEADPREYDALARDVGGRVVRVSPGTPTKALEALLLGTFLEWEQRRKD